MPENIKSSVVLYTDGSCHTQHLIGAWVAILFAGNEKIVLNDIVQGTTHNQMELKAVIEGISYIAKHYAGNIRTEIVTDSQYVIGLSERKKQLEDQHFQTTRSKPIQNADLVKQFYQQLNTHHISLQKIKAHQKKSPTINHNIEADKLSRKTGEICNKEF